MRRCSTLIVIVTAALTALAAACSGGDSLVGTSWNMIQLGPAGFPEPALFQVEVNMELSVDGTSIKGSGGCNSYSGSYTAADGTFATSDVSWTEIGCSEPQGILGQEARFFSLLTTVESFILQGDKLTLNAPGDELIVFLRVGGT